jgi:hypothetical protein
VLGTVTPSRSRWARTRSPPRTPGATTTPDRSLLQTSIWSSWHSPP